MFPAESTSLTTITILLTLALDKLTCQMRRVHVFGDSNAHVHEGVQVCDLMEDGPQDRLLMVIHSDQQGPTGQRIG